MGISASDVIALSRAGANFFRLAEEVKGGDGRIITKNAESDVALIDASQLDDHDQLKRERIHRLLSDEASKGLADAAAGKAKDARCVIQASQAPSPRLSYGGHCLWQDKRSSSRSPRSFS